MLLLPSFEIRGLEDLGRDLESQLNQRMLMEAMCRGTENPSNKSHELLHSKTEQPSGICRKRKGKSQRDSPACASCQARGARCSFKQIVRRSKHHEKRSLDLMTERIERIERMLRQRGFLEDEKRKANNTGDALEGIIGKDPVATLGGAAVDVRAQTRVAFNDGLEKMRPPPIPDKPKALERVEKWLETLPPYIADCLL